MDFLSFPSPFCLSFEKVRFGNDVWFIANKKMALSLILLLNNIFIPILIPGFVWTFHVHPYEFWCVVIKDICRFCKYFSNYYYIWQDAPLVNIQDLIYKVLGSMAHCIPWRKLLCEGAFESGLADSALLFTKVGVLSCWRSWPNSFHSMLKDILGSQWCMVLLSSDSCKSPY